MEECTAKLHDIHEKLLRQMSLPVNERDKEFILVLYEIRGDILRELEIRGELVLVFVCIPSPTRT
jgi:hypothetical protein